MTLALLILVALIVIGFVRFSSQKNKEAKEESSQSQEEIPSSYQTTQEMDESYYRETFSSPDPEESPVKDQGEAITEPKPKKSSTSKKTSTKSSPAKKTTGKKPTAKKSPVRKKDK